MTNQYDNHSNWDLANYVAAVETKIALYTGERKDLLAEIARRFGERIAEDYAALKKQHGKITIKPRGATFTLEVDTRQTVKWDQTKLMDAGEKMKPEEAKHIIDVELSVSEKTYNALPPGDVKKALTDARTTKLSAPSIKVVFPTGEKS